MSVALVLLSWVVWYFWLSPLDSRTRAALELLHTTAKVQIKASRLIDPPGDNALETYRQILAIYPRDRQAKAALENLAVHYQGLVRNQLKQGEFTQSLALVEKGLLIDPDHTALLDLKKTIERQIEAQRRRGEITELLHKAESQFEASLSIQPDNQEAEAGLLKITEYYRTRAEAARQANEYDDALSNIAFGLKAVPHAPKLLTLQDEVKTQLENTRHREELLAELRIRVKAQLAAGHYTEPAGDNANETYQRVQKLNHNNRNARIGIDAIVDRYEAIAREDINSKQFDQALKDINSGRKIDPNHPGLIALLQELAARKLESPSPPQLPSGPAEEPEQVPEKKPVLAPFGGTF
jgi:tetratricopeptide (TPR) repeat protein